MKIIICVKQVPDTQDISWTEKNTMKREGVESVINPFDEFAIESALRIKDKNELTQLTALSMGPQQAEAMLKSIIAKGVDEAILLSDKKFAGADTYATSKTLATAIRNKIRDFDLIVCGQFATDGDTGQTGPAIAAQLSIPCATFVNKITNIQKKFVEAQRLTENEVEYIKINLPAVICLIKPEYELRPTKLSGYIKAHDSKILILNANDIGLSTEDIGIQASPTYVSKAFRPEQKTFGEILTFQSSDGAVDFLVNKIDELKKDITE